TLSFEPSLIFIGIGAVFGIKIGISMLLGLVLNYGILAPNLINQKIVRHAAPEIKAAAAPQFPLSVAVGDKFNVVLTEATATPKLKANPPAKPLVYTGTKPTAYNSIAEIRSYLSAPTLQDSSANPLSGFIAVGVITNKETKAVSLSIAATAATSW